MVDDLARRLVHDARGSLNTMRLSLGAVIDDGEDAAFRREMLTAADAEARRLLACLTALPIILKSPAGPTRTLDAAVVLPMGVAEARSQGFPVDIDVPDRMPLECRFDEAALASAMATLFMLLAGAADATSVEIVEGSPPTLVVTGGQQWAMAARLIAAVSELLGLRVARAD